MAEFPEVRTSERFYDHDGKIYLVRDVRVNGRRIRTEFAVLVSGPYYAELNWTPCEEGQRFDTIAPLSKRQ